MPGEKISVIAKSVKDIVFLWGTFSAVVGGSILYFNEYFNLFIMHSTEIGLIALTIVTSAIIWYSLSNKTAVTEKKLDNLKDNITQELSSIQRDMLRSDVDRWYKDHINNDRLSDDELKYLHYLKSKLVKHKVNSFSESKVNKLLKKFDDI